LEASEKNIFLVTFFGYLFEPQQLFENDMTGQEEANTKENGKEG